MVGADLAARDRRPAAVNRGVCVQALPVHLPIVPEIRPVLSTVHHAVHELAGSGVRGGARQQAGGVGPLMRAFGRPFSKAKLLPQQQQQQQRAVPYPRELRSPRHG